MKRQLLILVGIALWAAPTWAAFRFGLGSAVAKRSADLIDQAGANNTLTGDNVAATLAACPAGAVFDTLPTDLSTIGGIDPLGHVQPTGHTFPADHIYLYASSTTSVNHPAYAPGPIHITDIASTEYLNASPVFTDYAIYFYGCRELKMYYAHIRTISSAVQNGLANAVQNCSTYSTGGGTFYRCDTSVNVELQAGDLIGYGAPSGAIDWGAIDYRYTPAPFANPSRHAGTDQYYTVCPIDYFTPGPKAAMEALLGRFDGGYRRVTPPLCGQYNQDVVGAAKGFWYHPGYPNVPEDPHLALIDNNAYAPLQTISVGNSLPNGGGQWYIFIAASSGQMNRDFSQVTADGHIYCYDTFYDPLDQLIGAGNTPIYILQMLNSTTLQFEKQTAVSCAAAAPWAFTSNAVTFQR